MVVNQGNFAITTHAIYPCLEALFVTTWRGGGGAPDAKREEAWGL